MSRYNLSELCWGRLNINISFAIFAEPLIILSQTKIPVNLHLIQIRTRNNFFSLNNRKTKKYVSRKKYEIKWRDIPINKTNFRDSVTPFPNFLLFPGYCPVRNDQNIFQFVKLKTISLWIYAKPKTLKFII